MVLGRDTECVDGFLSDTIFSSQRAYFAHTRRAHTRKLKPAGLGVPASDKAYTNRCAFSLGRRRPYTSILSAQTASRPVRIVRAESVKRAHRFARRTLDSHRFRPIHGDTRVKRFCLHTCVVWVCVPVPRVVVAERVCHRRSPAIDLQVRDQNGAAARVLTESTVGEGSGECYT